MGTFRRSSVMRPEGVPFLTAWFLKVRVYRALKQGLYYKRGLRGTVLPHSLSFLFLRLVFKNEKSGKNKENKNQPELLARERETDNKLTTIGITKRTIVTTHTILNFEH